MEQINKIELRGTVGNVYTKSHGETTKTRFSIVTNYAYKSRGGDPVIETLWLNVTAWEGKDIPDLSGLKKGMCVHLIGRLRPYKYTSSQDGVERQDYEVVAREVVIVEEEALSAQMR